MVVLLRSRLSGLHRSRRWASVVSAMRITIGLKPNLTMVVFLQIAHDAIRRTMPSVSRVVVAPFTAIQHQRYGTSALDNGGRAIVIAIARIRSISIRRITRGRITIGQRSAWGVSRLPIARIRRSDIASAERQKQDCQP